MASNVALTGLARDLAKRAEEGRPVRIGLIGCGEEASVEKTTEVTTPGGTTTTTQSTEVDFVPVVAVTLVAG